MKVAVEMLDSWRTSK